MRAGALRSSLPLNLVRRHRTRREIVRTRRREPRGARRHAPGPVSSRPAGEAQQQGRQCEREHACQDAVADHLRQRHRAGRGCRLWPGLLLLLRRRPGLLQWRWLGLLLLWGRRRRRWRRLLLPGRHVPEAGSLSRPVWRDGVRDAASSPADSPLPDRVGRTDSASRCNDCYHRCRGHGASFAEAVRWLLHTFRGGLHFTCQRGGEQSEHSTRGTSSAPSRNVAQAAAAPVVALLELRGTGEQPAMEVRSRCAPPPMPQAFTNQAAKP